MFQNISVKDALKKAMAGEALLVDLRTMEEYKEGHLPMAICLEAEEIKETVRRFPGTSVILYCRYGNYSLKTAKELSEEGMDLYSIVGGYQAYRGYVERMKNDIWTMEWKNC